MKKAISILLTFLFIFSCAEPTLAAIQLTETELQETPYTGDTLIPTNPDYDTISREGYLYGVGAGTNPEELVGSFLGSDRIVYDGGEAVGTGSSIRINDENGQVTDELTVVVLGDVNGDGAVTAEDALLACDAAIGEAELEQGALYAADVDQDDVLTSADVLRIQRYVDGLEEYLVEPGYTLTFISEGVGVPARQKVAEGEVFTEPDNAPEREGYYFAGWFKDERCLLPFDFSAAVTQSSFAYAKWQSNEPGEYNIGVIEYDSERNIILTQLIAPDDCILWVSILDEDRESVLYDLQYAVQGTDSYIDAECELTGIELPEYFVIVGIIYSVNGEKLSNHIASIANTSVYESFIESTVNDYQSEKVINLDDADDNNFMVANSNTVIIYRNDTEGMTVQLNEAGDVVVEGNIEYITNIPLEKIVYMGEDGPYIIDKNNVVESSDNRITFTSPDTVNYPEYFDVVKVNVDAEGTIDNIDDYENIEIADAPTAAELEEMGFDLDEMAIDHNHNISHVLKTAIRIDLLDTLSYVLDEEIRDNIDDLYLEIVLSAGFGVKYSCNYDRNRFGDEYCDLSQTTYIECVASGKVKYEHEMFEGDEDELAEKIKNALELKDKNNPHIETVKFPDVGFPVLPQIEISGQISIPISIQFSGELEFSAKWSKEEILTYGTEDGINRIEKEWEFTPACKGNASLTFKIGIEGKIKAKFFPIVAAGGTKGLIECGLSVTFSFIVTIECPIIPSDSPHACSVCLDGKVDLEAKLTFTVSLNLLFIHIDALKLDVAKETIRLYDFYVSLVNDADSIFGGKITYGKGDCPNTYQGVTITATTPSGNTIPATFHTQYKGSGDATGDYVTTSSSGEKVYLTQGDYLTKAVIGEIEYRRVFNVSKGGSNYIDVMQYQIIGYIMNPASLNGINDADIRIYDQVGSMIGSLKSGTEGLDSGEVHGEFIIPSGDTYIRVEIYHSGIQLYKKSLTEKSCGISGF